MATATFGTVDSSKLTLIENSKATIGIESATGLIKSLVFKKTGTDLFQQLNQGIPGYIGGIEVYDELAGTVYSDWTNEFDVSNMTPSQSKMTALTPVLRISFERRPPPEAVVSWDMMRLNGRSGI